MNQLGRDFVNEMNRRKSEVEGWVRPKWGDSLLQERILRLGIEVRLFEIDVNEKK